MTRRHAQGRAVRFAGYAAVFDVPDRGGDVLRHGAFGRICAVPLLWQHDGKPVGRVERLKTDRRGLRVARHQLAAATAELRGHFVLAPTRAAEHRHPP